MSLIELFTKYKKRKHAVLLTTQFTNEECSELKAILLGSGYSVTTLFGNPIITECKLLCKTESAYLIFDCNNILYETLDKLAKEYNYNFKLTYDDIIFGPTILYVEIDSIVYEFESDTDYHAIDDVLTKYNVWHIKALKDKAKEILN